MTKEQALAIAADALREVGLERFAWVIEDEFRLPLLELLSQHEDMWDRDYEERYCVACSSSDYAAHFDDCFILHAWKYLGDPRYQAHVDRVAQEAADAAAREAARLEYERTRCTAKGEGRCRLREGHAGVHDFARPVTMGGLSSMLKELYPPERIENLVYDRPFFGVDRSADPVRLTGTVIPNPPLTMDGIVDSLFPTQRRGIVAETPVGHFDETGAWHPNRKDLPSDDPASKLITNLESVPSVIVSPFVKDGTAYLFQNTLAVSPNDSRADFSIVDAMKKAKEALDKMNGRKP